ncbi:ABC transporter ATP-binding protein [Spirochaeta cellobiosiphila]|uniref:ABC transporter ATP-binding protein n=1 Tax=Spirochaeta cellobiosiphila TaxID=504483 RepID=UPI00041B5FCD|nr:ABC transporter ATP-binding protein [Spirochaeta cellobiosiphila]
MIRVSDLYYHYPKTEGDILKGINFQIEQGEIFSLLGPSGAGKSTTLKILIGILDKYRGTVQVDKWDLAHKNRSYYDKIGVSFEFPNLYLKLTALENLRFFASLYHDVKPSFDQLLDQVGLYEYRNKRVEDYSKGMKMRLNFCRALINDPDVLFLDEPVSGLDPVNARKVKDIIQNLKSQGKTIFLTTHNMTIADELSDRVAFMVDGKIPLIDSPHHLKVERSQGTVRLELEQEVCEFPLANLGVNPNFLHKIKDNTILSLHSTEATLEDVFIEVTGQRLEQGEGL